MVTASRPEGGRRAARLPVTMAGAAATAARPKAIVPTPAILRNIGWLFTAQAIAGGGQFALSVLLARHLGAETYGQWAFAFAFVSLFAFFADFGFPMLAVRDLSRGEQDAGRYVGNVLLLKAGGSLLLVAVMIAILLPLERDATVRGLALLIAGHMLLTSFSQFLFSVFRARERTHFEALARMLQVGLLLGIAALLATRGAGALAFGWTAVAASAAGLAFTSVLVVTRFVRPRLAFDADLCKAVLKEVWPIGVAVTFTSIYYYADAVLLRVLGHGEAVGWYSAAYVPILGLVIVIGAIRNAYFPALSRNVRDAGHARYLREYGRLTVALALPVAFLGPLIAGWLLTVLYGAEFAPATTALRLLFVTGGVMCFSSYFGAELLATNRQRAYLVSVGAGALANVILNLALIPLLSLNGAAIATLAAEVLVCVSLGAQVRAGRSP